MKISEAIVSMQKEIYSALEKEVIENCVPKIIPPITAGKLKWRGLRLIQKSESNRILMHVEQRGVKITNTHIVNFNIIP